MPAIIAQLLRFAIIALVQSGFIIGAEAILAPLIEKAKEGIKSTFGLSDDDATTYVANFVLDTLELAGLTVVAMKSKIPLKIADKLGFTTKGYARRALPAKVSTGANAPGAAAKAAVNAGAVSTDTIAQGIAQSRGIGLTKVQSTLVTIAAVVGGTNYTLSTIGNWIDFGNWNSGAYQGTFNKIFAVFGLKPDVPLPKASTVSSDVWDRVYSTYVQLGAYAINDPYKMQSVIFSRQALVDLIDKVGAQLNLEKGAAPAKAVLGATHALILLKSADAGTGTSTGLGSFDSTSSGSTSATATKIFTGIVSQGVLGSGLTFTARPDDLIESSTELQSAATNNLAAALAAFPTALTYEIKIVSYIITKDGFKQTGASHQIVSSYKTDGTPKYKTVVNKFAVLNIYLMTEKGNRTKWKTVVLGPTNVLKFNPKPGDISTIENLVKSTVSTSDPSEIKSVSTSTQLGTDSNTTNQTQTTDTYTIGQRVQGEALNSTGDIFYTYTYKGNNLWTVGDTLNRDYQNTTKTTAQVIASGANFSNQPTQAYSGADRFEVIYNPSTNQWSVDDKVTGASVKASSKEQAEAVAQGASMVSSPSVATSTATTLYEFYTARGQALPSVAARASLYQEYGLGQAAFYTGTAEQNSKLLEYLKSKG